MGLAGMMLAGTGLNGLFDGIQLLFQPLQLAIVGDQNHVSVKVQTGVKDMVSHLLFVILLWDLSTTQCKSSLAHR